MKSLLLLEPDLQGSVPLKTRLIKSFPRLQLDHYESSEEAFKSFRTTRHPVVILELVNGGGLDGLELVQKIMVEHSGTSIFVTSEFPALSGLAEVWKDQPNIQCFKKPYNFETFVEVVSRRLAAIPDSLITGITPVNVLLMVHMELKNAYLEMITERGPAYLCFAKGQLFHASQGTFQGDQAVLNTLGSTVSQIRLFEGHYKAESNVQTPLTQLLVAHRQAGNESATALTS